MDDITWFRSTLLNDHNKILSYFIAVEELAEEIINDKREMVLLDKRRNQNREALRDLKKSSERKCWVTVGSVLVKQNLESTAALLEKDQMQINIDINKLRSDLNVKINKIRDLEMLPPVPGLLLDPLTDKESKGLKRAVLYPKLC